MPNASVASIRCHAPRGVTAVALAEHLWVAAEVEALEAREAGGDGPEDGDASAALRSSRQMYARRHIGARQPAFGTRLGCLGFHRIS